MIPQGQESLGMAMVFTLVSQLQEALRFLVDDRVAKRKQRVEDAARREAEASSSALAYRSYLIPILKIEEARTKGIPVTPASFAAWRIRFNRELARNAAAEEEERLKTMTPKERDEYKRSKTKLSGKRWPYSSQLIH